MELLYVFVCVHYLFDGIDTTVKLLFVFCLNPNFSATFKKISQQCISLHVPRPYFGLCKILKYSTFCSNLYFSFWITVRTIKPTIKPFAGSAKEDFSSLLDSSSYFINWILMSISFFKVFSQFAFDQVPLYPEYGFGHLFKDLQSKRTFAGSHH